MEIINLNLIPGKAWPVAHATQFDKGREFRANLFEGSQVYTLAGDETVDAIIKKPDGNQVIETLVNTADNYVIVTTTEQMTAVAGPSLGEIRISKGDTVIGSLKFILECEQSADTGIESHSEINNLETQVAAIVADQYAAEDVIFDNAPTAGHGVGFAVTSEGVKDAIDNAVGGLTIPEELDDLSDVTITSPSNGEILVFDGAEWVNQANPASTANFAADYDDTATYNTNDKVIYQGRYYIALEDNITGAWDSTKWALTTVSALTADELPLSANDSTPTATAIGDLSALTTSVTSSLVGAVKEVDGNTKPVYLSTITTGSNISFSANTSYRVGNLVVLNCILKVTGNLANNATILSNIPKNDVNAPIRFLRVVGSDVYYGHDDNAGGFNIDANATSVTMFGTLTASSSSPKYLFVNITYICSNA